MPLSWNEIRANAVAFSREWRDASSESAEAQTFWGEFFRVFGITHRRVASFEAPVRKSDGSGGAIDLLWKGVLVVEHKSRGYNLDRAYHQALNYFSGLNERDLPRYVLVSDFARFRLYDLDENAQHEFTLEDLHKNVNRFAFIAGYQTHKIQAQDPVNIEAAERMGRLHDQLADSGYTGHDLEVLMVRLLFCMFAEDTGIFERRQFQSYIEDRTDDDAAFLGALLGNLFDVLNRPAQNRQAKLDEQLAAFPFINGKLFEERLRTAAFDRAMRKSLLECCSLDWSRISPAIFGSLFQSIKDKKARRNLGAHYTSEANILKVINPLFMDELRAEFEKVKNSKNGLFQFHKKLHALKFLDPACGCGNFLVIAYRELRQLELEILRVSLKGSRTFDVHSLIALNADQFYGIEIEEFPAQIAQVAMWLMDHQMNLLVSEEFGIYFARIPLETGAGIVHGNALQIDWRKVVAPEQLDYIMGNPPFIGHQYQSTEQKAEMLACYRHVKKAGMMDYVTAWYCKAVDYISAGRIRAAFVSTNSITQGEQVAPLWTELRARHPIQIHFAHRTFNWTNEARGKAAVFCVIIGFGAHKTKIKRLFEYEYIKGEPHEIKAKNINPYLVDAPDVFVKSRGKPICEVPPMVRGSAPVDGGNLLLNEEEKNELIAAEPQAEEWIRPYSMGNDFINGIPRFCLWLKHCPPEKLRKMPRIMKRVEAVRETRGRSAKQNTRKFAEKPTVFMEDRQVESAYLAVPQVSSERRRFIPTGYLPPNHIAGNMLFVVSNADLYDFGVVTSSMHMAWMRTVCGRLKSDYRYSAKIVYNNFPWPQNPTGKQTADIESKARAVLDARAQFPDSTLADLYDPLTMPPLLLNAHQSLDKAVDRAYHNAPFANEAARVAFLFDLYQQYTAPTLPKKKRIRQKRA